MPPFNSTPRPRTKPVRNTAHNGASGGRGNSRALVRKCVGIFIAWVHVPGISKVTLEPLHEPLVDNAYQL